MNFLTMLVNTKKHNNEKQTISVQCQSQTTCLSILHYHLQQKHIQVIKLIKLQKEVKSAQKTAKL